MQVLWHHSQSKCPLAANRFLPGLTLAFVNFLFVKLFFSHHGQHLANEGLFARRASRNRVCGFSRVGRAVVNVALNHSQQNQQ